MKLILGKTVELENLVCGTIHSHTNRVSLLYRCSRITDALLARGLMMWCSGWYWEMRGLRDSLVEWIQDVRIE